MQQLNRRVYQDRYDSAAQVRRSSWLRISLSRQKQALWLGWLLGLCLSVMAASVHAQPSGSSKPAPGKAGDSPYEEQEKKPATLSQEEKKKQALQLLLGALKLKEEGRCNEALHRLDSSLALYDSPATRIYKAHCLLALRRYVAAKALAAEARELAFTERQVAIALDDQERAEALQRRASEADGIAHKASKSACRLTIVVPSSARAQSPLIQYQHLPQTGDTTTEPITLPQERHNRAVVLDPGHYRVVVSAPQMNPWTAEVYLLANGGHATITVPALTEAEQLTTPVKPPMSSRRIAAATIGAMGLMAIIAGAAVGATILQMDTEDNNITQDIRDRSAASLVAIGVGSVAAGIAGVLWVFDKPQEEGVASVGLMLSPAMTGVRVRF